MSIDLEHRRSRRTVLAGALGALGGLVASSLGRPGRVEATTGDQLTAGGTFSADQPLTLSSPGTVLMAESTSGIGLIASSGSYVGVVGSVNVSPTLAYPSGVNGSAGDGAIGVFGHAADGEGVYGVSGSAVGLRGLSAGPGAGGHSTGVLGIAGSSVGAAANTDQVGVHGYSNDDGNATGVWGDSPLGIGVVGTGDWGVLAAGGSIGMIAEAPASGTAVFAYAGSGTRPNSIPGVAVQATAGSTSQTALSVSGRVKFSRSGRTYVVAGHSTRVITMAGVTTSSYIIATPQTNRAGVHVQAVVPAAGKFTIYLSKAVSGTTYVGYLVIN